MNRRVAIACATFKGSLSSRAAGEALARGLQSAGVSAQVLALADGGEGLVEVLAKEVKGALMVGAPCRDPLQLPRTASFAVLPAIDGGRKRVVIEMAESSGLTLVPEDQRNPMLATSLGVGDQILAALAHLAHEPFEILLGLGGSATNDGGAGMAQALGAALLDERGRALEPGGANLIRLHRIDVSKMHPRCAEIPVTVACDVRSSLCGPEGASVVFGPQKGASPEDVEALDRALAHYAEIIRRDLGRDVANIPGAGAAGGLGAGCLAFLNATLKPGIELVLDTIDFDRALEGVDLVITGEGLLDSQTLMGKTPAGVAARARKKGVPCVAIGGGIEAEAREALLQRFALIESLSEHAGSKESALLEPGRWLESLARERAGVWLGARGV